jgi:hypothetical protein
LLFHYFFLRYEAKLPLLNSCVKSTDIKKAEHLNWPGIPFDRDMASDWAERITMAMSEIATRIHVTVGHVFNISSLPELRRAIFWNPFVTKDNGDMLKPLWITDKEQAKVDIMFRIEAG